MLVTDANLSEIRNPAGHPNYRNDENFCYTVNAVIASYKK